MKRGFEDWMKSVFAARSVRVGRISLAAQRARIMERIADRQDSVRSLRRFLTGAAFAGGMVCLILAVVLVARGRPEFHAGQDDVFYAGNLELFDRMDLFENLDVISRLDRLPESDGLGL